VFPRSLSPSWQPRYDLNLYQLPFLIHFRPFVASMR
jgi:hypothetical protein